MSQPEILGWAQSMADQTVYHLMLDVNGVGHCACGSRGATHGQVEAEPSGNRCKRCLEHLKRRARHAERLQKGTQQQGTIKPLPPREYRGAKTL